MAKIPFLMQPMIACGTCGRLIWWWVVCLRRLILITCETVITMPRCRQCERCSMISKMLTWRIWPNIVVKPAHCISSVSGKTFQSNWHGHKITAPPNFAFVMRFPAFVDMNVWQTPWIGLSRPAWYTVFLFLTPYERRWQDKLLKTASSCISLTQEC